MAIPLWLDCDTGHDDAFAILLAAYHPRARLLGVSTVHGNAPLSHTTNNTLAVLEALGQASVEVVKGADRPLQRPPSFAPDIHGETGLDGVTLLKPPVTSPSARSIKDVAASLLSEPAGTVQLVATGPLTNVATMLIEEPRLAHHLAGLSIMGGAIGGGYTDAPMGTVKGQGERFGNWTPWAEFNIIADPDAAKMIFDNETMAAKTTIVPLDLTHKVRGVATVQDQLFGKARWQSSDPSKPPSLPLLRGLFREILTYFSGTYASHFGIADGPPLHDPLAVWAVLRPGDFHEESPRERWHVNVNAQPGKYHVNEDPDNHLGQTVLKASSDGRGVRVPRSLNIPEFWNDIDAALQAAIQADGSLKN